MTTVKFFFTSLRINLVLVWSGLLLLLLQLEQHCEEDIAHDPTVTASHFYGSKMKDPTPHLSFQVHHHHQLGPGGFPKPSSLQDSSMLLPGKTK